MKVFFEFTLPEEESDYKDAIEGFKWKLVCGALDDELRRIVKYGGDEKLSLCAQMWRDKLHELIQEHNLNLWD